MLAAEAIELGTFWQQNSDIFQRIFSIYLSPIILIFYVKFHWNVLLNVKVTSPSKMKCSSFLRFMRKYVYVQNILNACQSICWTSYMQNIIWNTSTVCTWQGFEVPWTLLQKVKTCHTYNSIWQYCQGLLSDNELGVVTMLQYLIMIWHFMMRSCKFPRPWNQC